MYQLMKIIYIFFDNFQMLTGSHMLFKESYNFTMCWMYKNCPHLCIYKNGKYRYYF